MEKMETAITIESTSSSSTAFSKTMLTSTGEVRCIARPTRVCPEEVRVLELSECKAAALCLAEAFAKDDVAMYFVDTPDRARKSKEENWALHLRTMEYLVTAHCLGGLALTIGPNYDCVALWVPPRKNLDDLCTTLRSGSWRMHFQLSSEGRKRYFKELIPLLHKTKADILGNRDHDSYYLVWIGTKEEGRGKGYARRLIEYVGRMADAENRACYLEASNDAKLPLIYAKYGFESRKKIHLVRGKIPIELNIMVREPAKTIPGKPMSELD